MLLILPTQGVRVVTFPFVLPPPPVNKIYTLEDSFNIYDINNNYARSYYNITLYKNAVATYRYDHGLIFCPANNSLANVNYVIRTDSALNRLILYNCDASATYIQCNTDIPNTSYYITSICISNKVLYAIATSKIGGGYPGNIGTGIYVFSKDISTINLATTDIVFGSVKASLTTGSIKLWGTNIFSGLSTIDDNNNIYITTLNGIYVYNIISNSLSLFMDKNDISYTYNSVSDFIFGGPSVVLSSSNIFNGVYTSIAYDSSSRSLFLENISNFVAGRNNGERPIDVININKANKITPYIFYNSGYFIPAYSAKLNNFSGLYTNHCYGAFDSNNNYYFVNTYTAGFSSNVSGVFAIFKILCFKEDTQILTYDGYKLIQDLRKGDLVKTSQNGYKPIYKIGDSKIIQQSSEDRIKDQLYKCSTENFPEVFEDLVLTGCHCILVDKFKDETEREDAKKINMVNANDTDDDFITENKYRLPACIDERTTVYEVEGEHTIYHFALENDDYYMNYGVYANGLLVESTSKRFMDQRMINELE
jgi:hypothetical protein